MDNDDVLTMDGNSMYSRVGYNLKKPINKGDKGPFGGRKKSILDDFESVAKDNESQEEMLDLSKPQRARQSMQVSSPRKGGMEMGPVNVSPSPYGKGELG